MRRGPAAAMAVLAVAAMSLVANEIFLQHPFGTRSALGPVHLAGNWRDVDTEIQIGPDGSVRGHFGGRQIRTGRITANRTWVGRTLGLRSEYRIDAELVDGTELRAPLNLRADKLEGAWFVGPDFNGNGPLSARLTRT